MRNTIETKIKEQFQMPTYHSVPLIFHDEAHARHTEIGDAALGYRVVPADSKQKVHRGRFLMVPDVNLNDYKCRAVIDWLEIGFTTIGEHQAGNMHNFLARELKGMGSASTVYVSGHEREKGGYQGKQFLVRVQDPLPKEIIKLQRAMKKKYEIVPQDGQLFAVTGIEVSIDFYPLRDAHISPRAQELARWRMSELLRKHVAVDSGMYRHRHDGPRAVFGKGSPTFIVPIRKRPSPPKLLQAMSDGTLRRVFQPLEVEAYRQPPIDGTVKIGRKGKGVTFNVQDKVGNKRNGATWQDLGDEERRSRIEVAFLWNDWEDCAGPISVGVHSLEDLYGFWFPKIRKPAFDFYLPTIAADSTDPESPDPTELAVFTRSGVLGLHEYQRAKQAKEKEAGKKGKKWANFDETTATAPRGYRVAYQDLNDMVWVALRNLFGRWRRKEWMRVDLES